MGTRSQLSIGFVTVARRDKTPALYRFSGGSVQRFAAGAAVDLHLFRSTVIVDQNAQKYSPFAALADAPLRILRSGCFAIARLSRNGCHCLMNLVRCQSRTVASCRPRPIAPFPSPLPSEPCAVIVRKLHLCRRALRSSLARLLRH